MISGKRDRGLTSFFVDAGDVAEIAAPLRELLQISVPEGEGLTFDYSWKQNTLYVTATNQQDLGIFHDISADIQEMLFTHEKIIEWMWRENVE
jgi:hypothetical protein